MSGNWYVFLNQDTDGYEVNRLGKQAARSVPLSLPYYSAALAHDNLITRQFFPLNERQLHAIEALKQVFGNGVPKAAARNQIFLDALIFENRWRGGELRPSIACRDTARMVVDPTYIPEPQAAPAIERTVGAGGFAPRARRQLRRLHEQEREVGA